MEAAGGGQPVAHLVAVPGAARRVAKDLATDRNRLVAALADEVVFAHVAPGGQLDELRQLVVSWRIPSVTLEDGGDPPR